LGRETVVLTKHSVARVRTTVQNGSLVAAEIGWSVERRRTYRRTVAIHLCISQGFVRA
jgi:hypothetical protein